MVKHLQLLNQLSLGLALVALSATVGGCALFGGGDTSDQNVKPSPQASPQTFPSPTLPAAAASGTKVALTRPTNPDERVKAIKSGRNDPFAQVVASNADSGQTNSSTSATASSSDASTPQEKFAKNMTSSYQQFLNKISQTYEKSLGGPKGSGKQTKGNSAQAELPKLGGQMGGQLGDPSLTTAANPQPMNIKVMGIASVGGVPQAIVQAPGEPTSRTVGVGDSLSGGSLIVKSIDTSNPADPVVVFQQGSIAFSVGVGREPSIVASR